MLLSRPKSSSLRLARSPSPTFRLYPMLPLSLISPRRSESRPTSPYYHLSCIFPISFILPWSRTDIFHCLGWRCRSSLPNLVLGDLNHLPANDLIEIDIDKIFNICIYTRSLPRLLLTVRKVIHSAFLHRIECWQIPISCEETKGYIHHEQASSFLSRANPACRWASTLIHNASRLYLLPSASDAAFFTSHAPVLLSLFNL